MTAATLESGESGAEIFLRFLKFGLLAWGGPAAQIAMIKRECVDEEMWISDWSFKKLLAVYQILPGPEAHELCVYFGRLRGGKLGGFLAGLGFMLPGFILMLGLSILYVEANLAGHQSPELSAIHLVRHIGDLTPAMPRFVTAFLEASLSTSR